MTFTEAAIEVLRLAGKPLHYKDITDLAVEKNLLSHVGKSPDVTMGARLAALLKKEEKTTPIVRVRPGIFGLRDWSIPAKGSSTDVAEGTEVNALDMDGLGGRSIPVAAPSHVVIPAADDDSSPHLTGADALRAGLAAGAAALFQDEDDDDLPILGGPAKDESSAATSGAEGGDETADASRNKKRRRRRGRGRGRSEDGSDSDVNAEGGDDEASEEGVAAGGEELGDRELTGEELSGKDLADAIAAVLSSSDRSNGSVSAKLLTDILVRKGRVGGEAGSFMPQVMACIRADIGRALATSHRPRFRLVGNGRVALTDWSLPPDVARLEREAVTAVERYRDAVMRTFLRRVQDLPGHALVELALLTLEQIGFSDVRPVRRLGAGGGEAHFSAKHKGVIGETRFAIVIRKDGREVGRERVADLRGSLHHYDNADAGWLMSTGQALSGARDEAHAAGAAPITVTDGYGFCKLLQKHRIGTNLTQFTLAVPDESFFEALRGN